MPPSQLDFSTATSVHYTPCLGIVCAGGGCMAVAGHDMVVDLYQVGCKYVHYARCQGHSATVLHLDFSSDGRVLRSTCNGYEILCWEVKSGKRLVQNQRHRCLHGRGENHSESTLFVLHSSCYSPVKLFVL